MSAPADLLLANLSSPVILAFALGFVARLARSDLRLPDAIRDYLAVFLLLAIGLKGGAALAGETLTTLAGPALLTVAAGLLTCLSAFVLARRLVGAERADAAALAAHYGSTSAVTFIAATAFVMAQGTPGASWMVAMLVLLEIPALLLAGLLARGLGSAGTGALREVLLGKSSVLLLGGLAIGWASGPGGLKPVEAMYVELFQGMLMLYLLDLGMTAADSLRGLGRHEWRLAAFGLIVPMAHGLLAVLAATQAGFEPANATLFATLVASASYIAAPLAVRASIPDADVGRCVAAALGVTFPFNLVFGIPALYSLSQALAAAPGPG